MGRAQLILASALAACCVAIWAGCERSLPEAPVAAMPAPEPVVVCDCELSSWIVTGRARHLVLVIDCPDDFDVLDGVVEFTTESMRWDYEERRDAEGALLAPRVARMNRGARLLPWAGDPDERVEATWEITVEQARALQADVLWETPYVLIGSNSNSGMVWALRSAGLTVPERVLDGGGVFGEFPGVDQPLGALITPE